MNLLCKRNKSKLLVFMLAIVMVLTSALNIAGPSQKASAASYIKIKNVWNNAYLYEDGNKVKYGNVNSESAEWELIDVSDGSKRIKNRDTGNYMNVENLQSYVESSSIKDDWYSARWFVEDAGNGQKRIKNSWQSTYIHLENLQGYVQAGHIYDAWDSAKWVIEYTGTAPDPEVPDPGETPDPEVPDPGETPDPEVPDPGETPDPEVPDPDPTPIPEPEPGTRGATMPYVRYESEDARIGGGASLRQALEFEVLKTAAEASNQQYVALPSNGSYVEWTINDTADGVTMRFTMPDSSDGMGLKGSLDAFVNGTKVKTIDLSSYWSWQYFNGDHPMDTPGGAPRFRFDEVHFKLNTSLKSGDTFRIQKTNGDGLEYGVDFIEIEAVPNKIEKPSNYLSVTDYGATPNDTTDDLKAFEACVAAADKANKNVYIPEGKFNLGAIWVIEAADIKITGAGMWYTEIHFSNPNRQSGGISGSDSCSNLDFGNVYISSMLRSRYDQQAVYKCFMDTYGTNSYIHDFWLEHFECGFWIGDYDIPVIATDNLVIANGRIRNNLADGVNFCQGTKNSTVVNCSVRNNGDDGLAVWPDNTMGAPMGVNNTFKFNTIENNWRAAAIAIFGGDGHRIHNNYIKDCYKGSGIRMNTTFPGYHFDNTKEIKFSDNTIINSGTSVDCYNGERGAIDLEASSGAIRNVTFENIEIYNAQRDAIQMGYGSGFSNINFNNILIDGTGKDAITTSRFTAPHEGKAFMAYTGNGSATFRNLVMKNIEAADPFLVPNGFNLTVN